MAAKAGTGQVHQPLAKSPFLRQHFYGENLSLSPLLFLYFSFLPRFPFFFFSFLSYCLHFPSLFFTCPFLFPLPLPFMFFYFLHSISFPLPLLLLSSFHFLFFSSSFPPPLMGGWGVWRDRGQRHYKCQTGSFSWGYRLSPFTAKGPLKRLFWHVFRKSHHCGQLG